MNRFVMAITLGLAANLVGTSAYANGIINFEGSISGGTCPIEIINPGDNSPGGLVRMTPVHASTFTAAGQEYAGKSFILRVKDGATCNVPEDGGTGTVTFSGKSETADSFAIIGGDDAAKGVAIAIRDATGTAIGSGVASAPYPLAEIGSSDMHFDAYYRSTTATVIAGSASAAISYLVTIN
ncbi:fimbrial protein [Pseudomonas sp. SIMBA_077]